jgi:type I restriction-modification system DNA methylase subunit
MLTSATKRKIDNARDILVGKIPMPTAQVEQITLALIYKFMSDIDKKSKALGDTSGFFANGYEKYAWDNLMDKSLSARDRVTLYSEGLEKMSKNPHIPQLFRDIFKNAFLPFRSPETLKLFLEQIDEFQYDHSEELGNAFEYLLSVMGSQGDAGQFRTPRHIIDFIVKVVDPSKTDTILDPACGTAGFLISAYKHIREKGLTAEEQKKLTDNFVGYDISHDMQRLAMVNMYLHHFPDPKIFEYDTLSSEDRWDDDFDVILANPPFMTPKGGIKPHSRFSVKSKKAEVLFSSYMLEHLRPGGKMGFIIPDGIMFNSEGAYSQLRSQLIENGLWAVINLPGGIFNPYTDAKTSILFVDKNISNQHKSIYFFNLESDGFDLGQQRKKINKENDLSNFLQQIENIKNGQKLSNINKLIVIDKSTLLNHSYNSLFVGDYVKQDNESYIELRSILKPKIEKIKIKDDIKYKRITVRLYGKGVELRDEVFGKDIKTKSLFVANEGDFIISKIDARSGAFGIIPKELDGGIVTSDFPLFSINKEKYDPEFLKLIVNTKEFAEICKAASPGTSNRRRIKTNIFLQKKIPVLKKEQESQLSELMNEQKDMMDNLSLLEKKIHAIVEKTWGKI